MANIPHLSVPFQVLNGQWVTVEQDTDEEVAQCVRNICAFERGFRIEDPDFGINDPTFTVMPIDTEDISQALATYEDRALVDIFQEFHPDGSVRVRMEVHIPTSEDTAHGPVGDTVEE
jgi:phage baseplate assembly protein W